MSKTVYCDNCDRLITACLCGQHEDDAAAKKKNQKARKRQKIEGLKYRIKDRKDHLRRLQRSIRALERKLKKVRSQP